MNHLETSFDDLLLEAVDEILCSLGEPVKNSLYSHLEDDFGIKKHEIPKKIEMFSKIMHKIFGLGASRLEIKFMENLNLKMKINFECPDFNWSKWIENEISFIGNVNKMRDSYMNSGQQVMLEVSFCNEVETCSPLLHA
jgi:hypothetical protein